jgi:hypothetical protein
VSEQHLVVAAEQADAAAARAAYSYSVVIPV